MYKAEDEELFAAFKKYEDKHKGVKIELSQYPIQDMIPKTVAALDSGNPPDVAYADVYDFQVTGKWAFDGKLEDVSSVINPIRANFAPNTVETTFLYNVTHDQIEAMTMADRIVVMHDGIIEQIGTPLALFDRPANLFVPCVRRRQWRSA